MGKKSKEVKKKVKNNEKWPKTVQYGPKRSITINKKKNSQNINSKTVKNG